jgi:hypothetical protein
MTDQPSQIDLMYAFGDHHAYPADVLELSFTVEQIDAAVDAGYLDHDGEIVQLTEDGAAFLEAAVAAVDDATYDEPKGHKVDLARAVEILMEDKEWEGTAADAVVDLRRNYDHDEVNADLEQDRITDDVATASHIILDADTGALAQEAALVDAGTIEDAIKAADAERAGG